MLRLEGLDVSIGAVSILRNVNMELPAGKFTGLVGRNGAGKTTLMRAVMGILKAHNGSIHFDAATLDTWPTHQRARAGIGYMPEDRRLVPNLSVEENVLMPAWAAKLPDVQARLAKVYEMIPEVEAFAGRKAMQLSGGQQKLAALARALMCGTKVLLLDEPFEGVAPVLARRLAEVIADLKQEGLSILLTESDLSHSREMLDALFTIDRGAGQRRPAVASATSWTPIAAEARQGAKAASTRLEVRASGSSGTGQAWKIIRAQPTWRPTTRSALMPSRARSSDGRSSDSKQGRGSPRPDFGPRVARQPDVSVPPRVST